MFNQNFFNDYLPLSGDLLEAYRQLVIALTVEGDEEEVARDILRIKKDMVAVSQNTFNLEPAYNPTDSLKELSALIKSQKQMLFR
jgi:hypothetical protein